MRLRALLLLTTGCVRYRAYPYDAEGAKNKDKSSGMKTGRTGTWITLVLMGLTAASCAVGPRLIPVSDATRRIEFEGFSILPPSGENWFAASPEVLRVMEKPVGEIVKLIASFIKMPPPSKTHTIAAEVQVAQLPPLPPSANRIEILQQIKQSGLRSDDRHRVVASKISEDRALGSDCVRYSATSEDRGVPGYPGSIFIFDLHGFACLHPDRPSYFIQIEYSERRLPRENPLSSLEAEREAFLKSLVFTRLPGP